MMVEQCKAEHSRRNEFYDEKFTVCNLALVGGDILPSCSSESNSALRNNFGDYVTSGQDHMCKIKTFMRCMEKQSCPFILTGASCCYNI